MGDSPVENTSLPNDFGSAPNKLNLLWYLFGFVILLSIVLIILAFVLSSDGNSELGGENVGVVGKSCQDHFDCPTPSPLCFAGSCMTTAEVEEYVSQNYERSSQEEFCQEKECSGCESGHMVDGGLGYGDFYIDYCIECNGNIFTCNEGYECVYNKCVVVN